MHWYLSYRWHTVVVGLYHPNGTMQHINLGLKAYIHQMNAAGRLVAAKEGLFLVDFEAMVVGFHDTSHLLDMHHQSRDVSYEAANIYLNLLEQLPLQPRTFRSDLFHNET